MHDSQCDDIVWNWSVLCDDIVWNCVELVLIYSWFKLAYPSCMLCVLCVFYFCNDRPYWMAWADKGAGEDTPLLDRSWVVLDAFSCYCQLWACLDVLGVVTFFWLCMCCMYG